MWPEVSVDVCWPAIVGVELHFGDRAGLPWIVDWWVAIPAVFKTVLEKHRIFIHCAYACSWFKENLYRELGYVGNSVRNLLVPAKSNHLLAVTLPAEGAESDLRARENKDPACVRQTLISLPPSTDAGHNLSVLKTFDHFYTSKMCCQHLLNIVKHLTKKGTFPHSFLWQMYVLL